jgi:Lysozyme like domain
MLLFAALAMGSQRARSTSSVARWTLAELRALARSAGFLDVDTAAAVAMAESGGNPNAVGDAGTSFGLWQIHLPAHPEVDRARVLDPTYNAAQALRIARQGADWSPWSVFTSGAYRRFMPGAAAA